jgi:hypothetical protein
MWMYILFTMQFKTSLFRAKGIYILYWDNIHTQYSWSEEKRVYEKEESEGLV